ncbi:MAG TPA: MarR family transcriptional regulator [Acidimicrobiales bacterium]|nr:MarR family transcriptional regulator [Acidimicrobiales bacterium]
MTTRRRPFDPLAEAKRQWDEHDLDEPLAMYAAISLIHAQQTVTTVIDRALKPLDLTFARYEVLMLLSFASRGSLPITKVGERLLVHPTGITRLVDKLETQGLVRREQHPDDRRSVLVAITAQGRRVAAEATTVLGEIRFGFSMPADELQELVSVLEGMRTSVDP